MQTNVQFYPWQHKQRGTIICVDSYDNCVPVGWLYNMECPEGIYFHGVIDLIKKMEGLLDQMQFPQPFSKIRTFADVPVQEVSPSNTQKQQRGNVATFSVVVLFRQNSSWQGSLAWMEGKREECFRSVLELLYLMDSALGSKEDLL